MDATEPVTEARPDEAPDATDAAPLCPDAALFVGPVGQPQKLEKSIKTHAREAADKTLTETDEALSRALAAAALAEDSADPDAVRSTLAALASMTEAAEFAEEMTELAESAADDAPATAVPRADDVADAADDWADTSVEEATKHL